MQPNQMATTKFKLSTAATTAVEEHFNGDVSLYSEFAMYEAAQDLRTFNDLNACEVKGIGYCSLINSIQQSYRHMYKADLPNCSGDNLKDIILTFSNERAVQYFNKQLRHSCITDKITNDNICALLEQIFLIQPDHEIVLVSIATYFKIIITVISIDSVCVYGPELDLLLDPLNAKNISTLNDIIICWDTMCKYCGVHENKNDFASKSKELLTVQPPSVPLEKRYFFSNVEVERWYSRRFSGCG